MNEDNKPYDADGVRDGVVLSRRLMSRRVQIIACVLFAQMVMTGISWFVMKATAPEVVTFDMKGTWDIFMQQSAQQKMDEEKAKTLVTRFNQAMSDSLAAWQHKHNAIILVQPAVVSVQPDITASIRNDIAARMQNPVKEEK